MIRTREPKRPEWVAKANVKGLTCMQEHAARTVGYCLNTPIRVQKVTHWEPDGTHTSSWSYSIGRGGDMGCGCGSKTPEDCILRALKAGAMLRAFYLRLPEYDGRHPWPGTWRGSWGQADSAAGGVGDGA